ncbi:FAD-linked oxidase [Lysinibacillus sp. 2017]|uniref:D-arabinono-1,4-lactone oxidase n=1 Tax=unclassified Lysinibacillus TaxID=2636778 RepID=UPI000D52A6A1|nr:MULTISPECIES: D-arabinono-1,4-lactone oxidase [unclassified Lysinibacillus]AWE07404.1 FAD-linked oxidase [Lysinibacillus sp. 2017]TGN36567.1 FAD-binding protein [Lysinibacillus sp. S2017]
MFSMKNWEEGQKWTNWSESYLAYPSRFFAPHTVEEVCQIVKEQALLNRTIRVTGAAHSFSPVAMPEQTALTLHHLRGLISIDKEAHTATFYAGTYLYEVGPILAEYGLALINMGDIQQQTLAGAISTGTHGTGITLGSFASMVTRWGIVTGEGDYLEHDRGEDALTEALHVSVGMLGILVKVTIQVIPLYSLAYTSERHDFHSEIQNFQQTIRENRNVEWFYFPGSNQIQVKKMKQVAPQQQPKIQKIIDQAKNQALENGLFYVASELCKRKPSLSLAVSRIASNLVGGEARTGISYEIYPSPRNVKFVETEYAISIDQFEACMEEVHAMFLRKEFDVHFPIEVRTTAGEMGYLSPTQGLESTFLAFHMYKGMNESPYFNWIRNMMVKYDGRPHWGKMNNYDDQNIEQFYPNAAKFNEQRKQLDPYNVFLTTYFKNIFDK